MSKMSRRGLGIAAISLAALFGVGGGVYVTYAPQEYTAQVTYSENGVAIRGTDPVAYFTEKRPVTGVEEFSAQWNGAKWLFASPANRDKFVANPEAFAPQYGGFCAWAVAAKGKLYSTQPQNWSIVDGKLYLNFNDDIQARWEKDVPGFIKEGDLQWPKVSSKKG